MPAVADKSLEPSWVKERKIFPTFPTRFKGQVLSNATSHTCNVESPAAALTKYSPRGLQAKLVIGKWFTRFST